MNIVLWVLFGLLVGVVANAIDPAPARGGLLGAIILGIVGALIGGFLSNLIFGVGVTGFDFTSFAIAVLGALLLLLIGRSFKGAP
ncbi:MAG: GlsB/YeaQ/YmgE family stress response membrane protein [Candidatus Levybacteria bacterium]|nr:GlsB/YeaQ/YmgE family stress response membrane protein [Candidatus Levybacteria bacterium]